MAEIPDLDSSTASEYEMIFKNHEPAFCHIKDIAIENVITFKSRKVVFGTSRYCDHGATQDAWTSPTLSVIPILVFPIPYVDHDYTYHENPATEYEHHTYIFVGHTDRNAFHVVALSIVIDLQISGPGLGPHDMPNEIVVRRVGNPRRIDHTRWFERARRCIVHLWQFTSFTHVTMKHRC